jgi:hypothetical protein
VPLDRCWVCFHTVLDKNILDCLLTRGVAGGDVKELLRGLRLVMAKFMHQGSIVHAGPECRNGVGVTDHGILWHFLGETSNVIPQGFALLLPTTLQIPSVAGPHVCVLKVAGEDLL